MPERPAKLPPSATLVVWGSRVLTLGEKVVWYHDWALDQGGADGAYASHRGIAARLGDSVTEATVSRVRQRLKRLTLHEPLRRPDARNLGWVATLPRHCVPRTHHEAAALAPALDAYLASLASWHDRSGRDDLGQIDATVHRSGRDDPVQIDATVHRSGRDDPGQIDATVQTSRTLATDGDAAALGGRGDTPFSDYTGEAQLPSRFTSDEKGVGAPAPRGREGRRRITALEQPLDADERQRFQDMLAKLPPERAAMMRRIAGL